MSMHQMEAFTEVAVRAVALSEMPTDLKRGLIFTLFEMEACGDCGFTNLRTLDEMVACCYTTIFDAEQMHDFSNHPEYYEGEQYNGPDGVYAGGNGKFCVDSGTQAWMMMVQNGKITGEAAEPFELLSPLQTLKKVVPLLGEMDSYLLDGFYCTVLLSGAFDEMTDDDALEVLGMTLQEFQNLLGGDDHELEDEVARHDESQRKYDFWGTTVSFVPKGDDVDEEGNYVLYGFRSTEGITLEMCGVALPFFVEIDPFPEVMTVNIIRVMEEMALADRQSAIDYIKRTSSNHPSFDVLVNNVLTYLQPIKDDPYFIETSANTYRKYHRIDETTPILPVSVRVVCSVTNFGVATNIYIRMAAEGLFSFDVHCENKYEIINEQRF